jgi:ubiquinone/menaquinone biosynthesis C-methylase UbiE
MSRDTKRILDAKLGKPQIRQVYSKLASKYDVWSHLAESNARKRCLEVAGIRNGESVLEVAVGTGILFQEILKINPTGRNEGIDLTEAMLVRAEEKAREVGSNHYALKIGDAYHLEYPDDSFDVVVNNYMFDLLPEPDFLQVLTEFRRVLRPGGRIILVNMTKGKHWWNQVWEGVFRISPSLAGGCRGVELRLYVEAAGFAELRREYLSQLTFPSEVIRGMKPLTPITPV